MSKQTFSDSILHDLAPVYFAEDGPLVRHLISRFGFTSDEAGDAVQDLFLNLWESHQSRLVRTGDNVQIQGRDGKLVDIDQYGKGAAMQNARANKRTEFLHRRLSERGYCRNATVPPELSPTEKDELIKEFLDNARKADESYKKELLELAKRAQNGDEAAVIQIELRRVELSELARAAGEKESTFRMQVKPFRDALRSRYFLNELASAWRLSAHKNLEKTATLEILVHLHAVPPANRHVYWEDTAAKFLKHLHVGIERTLPPACILPNATALAISTWNIARAHPSASARLCDALGWLGIARLFALTTLIEPVATDRSSRDYFGFLDNLRREILRSAGALSSSLARSGWQPEQRRLLELLDRDYPPYIEASPTWSFCGA